MTESLQPAFIGPACHGGAKSSAVVYPENPQVRSRTCGCSSQKIPKGCYYLSLQHLQLLFWLNLNDQKNWWPSVSSSIGLFPPFLVILHVFTPSYQVRPLLWRITAIAGYIPFKRRGKLTPATKWDPKKWGTHDHFFSRSKWHHLLISKLSNTSCWCTTY